MDKLTLYHNDMSVCSAKVRMALAEKNLPWEGVHLNLRGGDSQKPDYVKLNPNKVVPTLVHRGTPIIESNVICEYIEDVWPEQPLRPAAPRERASMRLWMKQLDDGVHAATGTVSMCIAFREQHLKRPPEDVKAWLANLVDPARAERSRLGIELGMDSPYFASAAKRFLKLLDDMQAALREHAWLAGPSFSLADLSYASYMARLLHLGFDQAVAARPEVEQWRGRLFARPSYAPGVEKWFNPSYLEIFARNRDDARKRIGQLDKPA